MLVNVLHVPPQSLAATHYQDPLRVLRHRAVVQPAALQYNAPRASHAVYFNFAPGTDSSNAGHYMRKD